MDLSKLPKLSDTPKPPDQTPQSPQPGSYEKADLASVEAGAMGVAWISIILGLLWMYVGRRFGSYLLAKLTGGKFSTGMIWSEGPLAGKEVAYFDLQGSVALSEAGIFLFGLALILEAACMMIASSKIGGKKVVLTISLLVLVAAIIMNAFASIRLMAVSIMPIWSVLAVALGGYMAMYQWKLLRVLSTGRAVPMT